MEKVIYYPGFEVEDQSWLKFALLYMDKIMPIIPQSADNTLTPIFKNIQNETDFFDIIRPEVQEDYQATNNTLDTLEKILKHPQRYSDVFFTSQINNILRNPKIFTHTLYKEKYRYDLMEFIVDNDLGIETDEGIKTSSQITNIFMTNLAQNYSDLQDIPVITDLEKNERFALHNRCLPIQSKSDIEEINLAKQIIKIKVPNNLDSISIDEIIKLRNNSSFIELRKAFNDSLQKYISNNKSNLNIEEYMDGLKFDFKDFNDFLISNGLNLVTTGLGLFLIITKSDFAQLELIKELSGSLLFSYSAYNSAVDFKYTRKKKHLAKQYLLKLATI